MTVEESIMDTSRPNAGRIYDYILGGYHNFEVDRQAAQQLLQLAPFLAKFGRLQRWCLQDIAAELTGKRGFDLIVDFASGLPTQEHIHSAVPAGTTVIYSDQDPVVVEYARDILKDAPNTYFFQADARRPEELLDRREVQDLLQGRRDVAFVIWGLGGFLADEDLSAAVRYLYEWAAPGSCLAFNAQAADVNLDDPSGRGQQINEIYARMGQSVYGRTLKQYEQLLQPWKVDGRFVPLLEWHGFSESELSQEDREVFGSMGGGYGAYLVK